MQWVVDVCPDSIARANDARTLTVLAVTYVVALDSSWLSSEDM